MSVINILNPHLADMIAAGEVVERPSSVIKELIENSLDAGAKNIRIEIRNGGTTYIKVSDDGCGMSPDDAGIAFLRHATSKIKSEYDLAGIKTMGFRGEALAAISAVSHMEVLTREKGAAEGTRVTLDAGDICEMYSFGCPEGTTVIVRDLFFNTPARLKFLKSDRAEASACEQAAMRVALGRPDVSFRFIKDREESFFSPGDGDVRSAVYALLGREEAKGLLELNSSIGGLSVRGFISSPSEGRGNRAHQFFFVNSRCIKSQLLQSALEQAYRNTLLTGRYPACVLYLELNYADVDVNVHPAKTEIKFAREREVFDFLYSSCKMALDGENRVSAPAVPRPEVPIQTFEPAVSQPSAVKPAYSYAPPSEQLHMPELNQGTLFQHLAQKPSEAAEIVAFSPSVDKNVENSVQNVEKPFLPDHKILGQAFSTYILVEHNGEIVLIDKHAAHERILFDRLRENPSEITSQLLLSPVTLRLSGEDAEALSDNGELLTALGFEIEPYGESEFIVRGLPADMNPSDVAPAIEEICEKLRSGKAVDVNEKRDEVLHTVACKAAIKAGWDTHPLELQKLVDAVLSGQVKYCPHGRPVSVTVTRRDLDKLFKRIV